MKTSTIVWTLAVLVMLVGIGSYFYMAPSAQAPAPTGTTVVNTNPNGNDYHPVGDMAPVSDTPIASSTNGL